jgi:hypothetical protein
MLARENFDGPHEWHNRRTVPQDTRARQAEVEVKVERRPDFLHLSLRLSLNLPITLAGFFSILFEEVATENQERTAEGGDSSRKRCRQLQLCDGLDQVLVDGHEVHAILLIDHHVGEADKEAWLFVNRIGHTIPRGRNEKVANVDAVYSPDADANLLAFGHGPLLPLLG